MGNSSFTQPFPSEISGSLPDQHLWIRLIILICPLYINSKPQAGNKLPRKACRRRPISGGELASDFSEWRLVLLEIKKVGSVSKLFHKLHSDPKRPGGFASPISTEDLSS